MVDELASRPCFGVGVHAVRWACRIAPIALAIGLGSALLCPWATAQPSARPTAGQPDRLTGTVRAVQVQAGTCDLLTGVGHALRIRRIHLASGLRVKTASGESPISALAPGSIVRVECRSGPEGTVASKVEVLEAPAAAGKR